MYHNYIFSNMGEAVPAMFRELIENGEEVGSRAGNVKELTHVGITLTRPWERELLVQCRRPNLAAQIAETMWVLSGRKDIGWLANYLPRATDFSDDGMTWRAGYGQRLRRWSVESGLGYVDQIAYVVDSLKNHALSRQAVASIWDPVVDTQPGKDIPCNDWLNFSSRGGKLDLHVAVRSNDAMWGWSGINAFEWSALQEIVAGLLDINVGALHFSTTSFHLYERHWARAFDIISLQTPVRALRPNPRFDAKAIGGTLENVDACIGEWFNLEKQIRNGDPIARMVNTFPEPMMQSWLRVLQWWWTGDRAYLEPIKDTRLHEATYFSIQPPQRTIVEHHVEEQAEPVAYSRVDEKQPSAFIQYAIKTHNEKHAAYGDSWKRRGEMLGIMANIARKVDRLGGSETADETSADTAMDLMVYLAKYRTWLDDNIARPNGLVFDTSRSDTPDAANELLLETDLLHTIYDPVVYREQVEDMLRNNFDRLEKKVVANQSRRELVVGMLRTAYRLARTLWEAEQEDDYQGADSADRDQLPHIRNGV